MKLVKYEYEKNGQIITHYDIVTIKNKVVKNENGNN